MDTLIVGNWKMKLSIKESVALADQITHLAEPGKRVVVCPSFVSMYPVHQKLLAGSVLLGAQDCFWQEQGAFTGEISAASLAELGCRYVIVGHSERRQFLKETNFMFNKKIQAVIAAGMVPVLCVGETLEQRQSGAADHIIIQQLQEAFEGIELAARQHLVIAYEPVWVIGSGRSIDPSEAAHAAQLIWQTMIDIFPLSEQREMIQIIYGGSVDATDVRSFIALPEISGVLVGGASLDASHFTRIVQKA